MVIFLFSDLFSFVYILICLESPELFKSSVVVFDGTKLPTDQDDRFPFKKDICKPNIFLQQSSSFMVIVTSSLIQFQICLDLNSPTAMLGFELM